jgi:hypothetical protein
LGSAPALAALLRWTEGRSPVVVLGPTWLAEVVAGSGPALGLVELGNRPTALRTRRRATKQGRPLTVALAADELPLRRGRLGALVVENVAGLAAEEAARWLAVLVPCLRPDGRLIAADATSSTDAAARVAGVFLASGLTDIVQEWPRDGAVLTVGLAPAAVVVAARFGLDR